MYGQLCLLSIWSSFDWRVITHWNLLQREEENPVLTLKGIIACFLSYSATVSCSTCSCQPTHYTSTHHSYVMCVKCSVKLYLIQSFVVIHDGVFYAIKLKEIFFEWAENWRKRLLYKVQRYTNGAKGFLLFPKFTSLHPPAWLLSSSSYSWCCCCCFESNFLLLFSPFFNLIGSSKCQACTRSALCIWFICNIRLVKIHKGSHMRWILNLSF